MTLFLGGIGRHRTEMCNNRTVGKKKEISRQSRKVNFYYIVVHFYGKNKKRVERNQMMTIDDCRIEMDKREAK